MGKSNQHRLKKQIREYPSHNCPKEHERVFWEELSEEGTMTWDLKREKEPVKKRLNSLQFQAGDSANGRVLRWEHMGWKSMVETKFKSPVSGSQVFSTWRYFCLGVPSHYVLFNFWKSNMVWLRTWALKTLIGSNPSLLLTYCVAWDKWQPLWQFLICKNGLTTSTSWSCCEK